MTVRALTPAEAPALRGAMRRLHGRAWPPFLRDEGVTRQSARLYSDVPAFQIALRRGDGRAISIGNTVPLPLERHTTGPAGPDGRCPRPGYPLTPMREYIRWRRPDGAPLNSWLRVHGRLRGRVLRVTPRGNTVRASIGDWETRTGLRFPVRGRYVVPAAFQPIRVERRRDRVLYEEANGWLVHPVHARRRYARSRRRSPSHHART